MRQGAIRVFRGRHPCRGSARMPAVTDPAARSGELPDCTNRGGDVRVRRTHRRSLGTTAGQAPAKDARQVEAPAGCGALTAGKVSADNSAILTVAGACDSTTAGCTLDDAARCRRSGGSAEGWDVAGGHPRFSGRYHCRRSAPEAGHHRYPPRDPVNSRTARIAGQRPGHADGTGALRGSTARQAPAKDARQVEAGGRLQGVRRERCLWRIPRYSPLRELATARRQALARDGTTAGLAPRRTRGVGCSQPQ